MKKIKISEIKKNLKKILIDASFILPEDILDSIKSAIKKETSNTAKVILEMIIQNAEIARIKKLPLCQDCGNVYINIEIGKDMCIFDNCYNSDIDKALNSVVAEVYEEFYLRKSIVSDPLFNRINTNTNTPSIIHYYFTNNSGLKIGVNLKGGGSENCSWLFMLNPSTTQEEIIDLVLDLVKKNASKACPPLIIGIGLGGSACQAVNLARKAVFRKLNINNIVNNIDNLDNINNIENIDNIDARYFNLEKKLLELINNTGIGPQGLGGKTTALACNIEYAPCHIATLPLAVFFGCHSTRRANSNFLN